MNTEKEEDVVETDDVLKELQDQMQLIRTAATLRRKVLNKRQYEVSKEAKVSDALVNLFEKGKDISVGKLERILRVLGFKLKIELVETVPLDVPVQQPELKFE